MFVRNCWYVSGWSAELPAEGLVALTLINEPLLIFRTSRGDVVALEDRCCHRQAPLSLGRREGDDIRCMYHGLKFDSGGHCIEIPGQASIPSRARVRRYAVAERHSWIWVWMGEESAADEALIPPAVGLQDPEYSLRWGRIDYQANHLLIHDNLCDFSHIAYVHENSFGGGDDRIAKTRPKISTLPRGIRVERWSLNSPGRDSFGVPAGLDRWLRYDYLVPGVLLMRSENHPVGTAAHFDNGEPTSEPIHANFTSQAVTALTTDTSRYFFSWGPRSSELAANPQLPDIMFELATRAFEEDRRIIEAQQRNLKLRPEPDPLMIGHDRGPSLFRAVMEKLLNAEAAPAS
ncbi:MAG TPA: aromatic ring-hydroxylating dioxygenase subunit alpha [Steroidobacteraceae bacterium]|jgi:vanillate O-demethylase monooxygenase subunit